MFGLGSSSQLGIGIAIRLHDEFSGTAAKINNQLTLMKQNAQGNIVAAATGYRNRAATVAAVAGGITAGMYQMAKSGAEFQHSINQVAIVGGSSLGKTRAQLTDFANTMTKTFSQSPTEVANVMFENVKAGLGKGLDEVTKYQIATAAATDEALAGEGGVGNKLLGIMNSMGFKATDQIEIGGKKMSQFARIANATTAASNATMASVSSIGESMQYFANTAHLAGMNLEQTLSLVGKLSQSNIKGSAAGVALSQMIQQMTDAAGPFAGKKKLAAFGALGINPQEIMGMINNGKTFEAIEKIDAASRRLPRGDRLAVLDQLFNKRGSRGLINAFMGGEKSLGDIRNEIEKGITGDVAMTQSKAMMNDLTGDMALLHNAFLRFKNTFTEAVGPTLRIVLNGLTKGMEIIGAILSTPLGKVFAGIVAVAAPVVAIMFGFRAAVLTATIALRGFSQQQAVGGFGGLLKGLIGEGIGSRMMGLGGRVGLNKAGRAYVMAGHEVEVGGKILKGGQLISNAALESLGFSAAGGWSKAAAASAATAGVGGKLIGYLGKAAPFMTKALGFMGDFLPIVGWIFTGVSILQGLFSFFQKDKAEEKQRQLDPVFLNYYRNLDDQFYGKTESARFYNQMDMSKSQQQTQLNQNIILNVDGSQVLNQNMKAMVAKQQAANINNQFNMELPE